MPSLFISGALAQSFFKTHYLVTRYEPYNDLNYLSWPFPFKHPDVSAFHLV